MNLIVIINNTARLAEKVTQGRCGRWTRHRRQHQLMLLINSSRRISSSEWTVALGCGFLVDLRDDRLYFRLVLYLELLLPRGRGWWSLPDAAVALACEPPSTSEFLATAIPRLNDVLVLAYRGVDVRDGDLVTDFDIARRDEVHLRVAIVERRSGGWVAGVSNVG